MGNNAHAITLKAIADGAVALDNGANPKAMAAYFRAILVNAAKRDNTAFQAHFTA